MTDEEMEKQAERHFNAISHKYERIDDMAFRIIRDDIKRAFLAGFKANVESIAELEKQINKMKHCFNCKFTLLDENNFYRCKKGGFWQFCGGQDCKEWECKE